MKKLLLFLALFLCIDRFMDYKVNKARRYARIEILKKEKFARRVALAKLFFSKKSGKNFPTQEGKSSATAS